MADSTLRFQVTGADQGATSTFRRMATGLGLVKTQATQAKAALAGIKSTNAKVDLDTAAVKRARDEINRLRDSMAEQLQADVNADTRPAQRRIAQLESSIRTLSKQKIAPQVDVSRLERLKSGLTSVKSALGNVGQGLADFGAGVGRVVGNVGVPVIGAIGGAAAAAATGVTLLGIKALQLADNLDNSKIAFTQFLKSGAAADKFLQGLRGFAAKTPFEFPELVESSKRLLAFGFAGKDIVPIMTSLGDAAALTGNSVDDLATIWGQMKAKGKIANEELLQLTERGVPGYQILADKLGISVSKVQELATEGKLGADALKKLQTGLDEKFGGGMAKQAETLGGMISTLKDTLTGSLTDIGSALLPLAKAVFPAIQRGAENLGAGVRDMLPGLVNGIAGALSGLLSLPGALLRGLAPVSQGFLNMVSDIQGSVAGLMGSLGASLMNIPGLTGFGAQLFKSAIELRKSADVTREAGKSAFDGLTSSAAKADAAVRPLKDRIEEARRATQQQLELQMKTDRVNTAIASVNDKIRTFKQQRANATLDADKKYFDQKIADARRQRDDLKKQKATIAVDAKIDQLKSKVVSAKSQLNDLKKQKPTPEVRAKINELEAKVRSGKRQLSDLNKQRPTPRADLTTSALNAAARSAGGKVDGLDRKKANPKADLNYAGVISGTEAAQRRINNIQGKTVTVTVQQRLIKIGGSRQSGASADDRSAKQWASAAEVFESFRSAADALRYQQRSTANLELITAASSINISAPSPQVTIVTRDAKLADFIGVQVDGKAARARRVVQRREVIQL